MLVHISGFVAFAKQKNPRIIVFHCMITNLVVLLRSESPSGMRPKLHTVAASNNRDHVTQPLLFLVRATLYGCYWW